MLMQSQEKSGKASERKKEIYNACLFLAVLIVLTLTLPLRDTLAYKKRKGDCRRCLESESSQNFLILLLKP